MKKPTNKLNSLSSILYQRGIYAAETFKSEKYHGIPMVITDRKDVAEYLDGLLKQIQGE